MTGTARTATKQAMTEGDEAVLAAMAAQSMDNPKPPLERLNVIGESGKKYLFRSKRGVLRGLRFKMDVKEDWWEDPQDDPASYMGKSNARVFLQSWKRRNTGREELLEKAYLDNGGPNISFIKMPPVYGPDGTEDNRQIEVYYTTDSDAIAEVIRAEIAAGRGDFQFVYEVDQSSHLKVGEMRFANTDVGLKLAHDHMTRSGVTSIEREAKAS